MNQNLYAPFKDKRVREAISLSIDRNGHGRGPLWRRGASLLNGVVTPGMPGYNPSAAGAQITIPSAPRS